MPKTILIDGQPMGYIAITQECIEVTPTVSETYAQLLNRLYTALSGKTITKNAKLVLKSTNGTVAVFNVNVVGTSSIELGRFTSSNAAITLYKMYLSSSSTFTVTAMANGGTLSYTDNSSTSASSVQKVQFYI